MLRSLVSSTALGIATRLSAAAVLTLSAAACGESPVIDDDGNDDTNDDSDHDSDDDVDSEESADTSETGQSDAWFEIGWGQTEFTPLTDGDTFEIVFGTQGSAMFPIILRGGDFVLPPDPADWQHEDAPTIELWLDIDGHNDGFGGHFKRIANYPLGFNVLDDGTYESTYIAIILPDDKDPEDLAGLAGTLFVEMDTSEDAPVSVQLDVTVELGDAPG